MRGVTAQFRRTTLPVRPPSSDRSRLAENHDSGYDASHGGGADERLTGLSQALSRPEVFLAANSPMPVLPSRYELDTSEGRYCGLLSDHS